MILLLNQENSLCDIKQKIIVSRDSKNRTEHRAVNKGLNDVRWYKLDGDIIKNSKMCDFLVVNDTSKTAFLIELKGSNIEDAIPQLIAGEKLCFKELPKYIVHLRLICSKARTHKINSKEFRKFKEKYGRRFQYKEMLMEENI